MKNEVINAIERYKLIAILRGVDEQKLLPLAKALYDGGIRILEITYGKCSDEQTSNNIKMLAEYFNGKMYIGAGTVLTKGQVSLTKAAGGEFVISPNTDKAVIEQCGKLELVSIPGALTPSEITLAHDLGADFVKLFPITNLGTEYLRAIKAPLSHIKLLAVGGINENNMSEYLACGVSGFGIGSNIANKQMIADNNWRGITQLAGKYVTVADNG